MTREEQNLDPEDMLEVMRAMRVRIRNAALRHFEHIDARTLRVLQDLELYEDDEHVYYTWNWKPTDDGSAA